MAILIDESWNGRVSNPVKYLVSSNPEQLSKFFFIEFQGPARNSVDVINETFVIRRFLNPVTIRNILEDSIDCHNGISFALPGSRDKLEILNHAAGQMLFIAHDFIEIHFERKLNYDIYTSLSKRYPDGQILEHMMSCIYHSIIAPSGNQNFQTNLLGTVCEYVFSQAVTDSSSLPKLTSGQWRLLNAWLDECDLSHVTVDSMAQTVGMSNRNFSRAFTKAHNCSPYQYVLQLKLRRATELLNGQHTLADVAILAGFCDQSKFCAQFKRRFGVTPLDYKRGERTKAFSYDRSQ
ncbi:AraC family transcriptional regulator [Pseudomonas sp.]|uniref:AraC family transcriptional regulator n=1 Tax=Pseudomonas sp. TaxID=306 RepID=UPI0028AC3E42|nr:AraC family transcriptional regulator [Pseudomonas sp.]